MKKLNEKQEMQNQNEQINVLKVLKYLKRDKTTEDVACKDILSYIENKVDFNIIMKSILAEISEAYIPSIVETEDHTMLKITHDYLNRKKEELNLTENKFIRDDVFYKCILCLKGIAQDALNEDQGELIKSRIEFFIDKLLELVSDK